MSIGNKYLCVQKLKVHSYIPAVIKLIIILKNRYFLLINIETNF